MPRIISNLWFDTEALEAAGYYCSIFPNSAITRVAHYTDAGPGPAGTVVTVGDPDPARADRAFRAMLSMMKIDIAAVRAAADGTGATGAAGS